MAARAFSLTTIREPTPNARFLSLFFMFSSLRSGNDRNCATLILGAKRLDVLLSLQFQILRSFLNACGFLLGSLLLLHVHGFSNGDPSLSIQLLCEQNNRKGIPGGSKKIERILGIFPPCDHFFGDLIRWVHGEIDYGCDRSRCQSILRGNDPYHVFVG